MNARALARLVTAASVFVVAAACSQTPPVSPVPNAQNTVYTAQDWYNQPRNLVPAGTISVNNAAASLNSSGNSSFDLDINGKVVGETCTNGPGDRWTLSPDKQTLTRSYACNGTTQVAVLHQVAPENQTYVGYYQMSGSDGSSAFGPISMTKSGIVPGIDVTWWAKSNYWTLLKFARSPRNLRQ